MLTIKKEWNNWLVDAIKIAYASGESCLNIGLAINRTEGQVRAKLVREGVYKSKSVKAKTRQHEEIF